ncbi:MAG: hypothetical protein ACYC3I_23605 [Gemmataceae bacterium]
MSFDSRTNESPWHTRWAAILWTAIVGILTTLVAIFSFRGQALVPISGSNETPLQGPVYTLTLPHDPPELPPGPHRESVAISCTICHSTRLLLNQPPFPREKWAEVVHKMAAVYGAPIPSDEEPRLVDYLVSVRGR